MDNPVLLITALSPGFVGIAVHKLLKGDVTAEPLQQGVLKYFLYAASSLFLTDGILSAAGQTGTISKILTNQQLSYMDCMVPMICAAVIAVLWSVCGNTLAVRLANGINRRAGHNPVFLDESMLYTMLADNKPHFLEVQFPDGRTERGYITKTITHEKTIMLEPEPDWTKSSGFYRRDVRKMIDLATGVVITEYEYAIVEQ